MTANYPITIKTYEEKQPGAGILSSHVNDMQAEITALETQLVTSKLASLAAAPVGAQVLTSVAGTPTWTAKAPDSELLDGLHAATSGANAHVLATDASGNAVVSGKVGIGATPNTLLELSGATDTDHILRFTDTRTVHAEGPIGEIQFYSKDVDFGSGETVASIKAFSEAGYGEHIGLMFSTGYFGSINVERIRVLSTGEFIVAGSVGQKATGDLWTHPSDRRLKKNITPFTDGLNVITKINPVHYELNGLGGTPEGAKGISVIAQDIQDVAPYTVETYKAKLHPKDKEATDLLRFDASALIFALINSVKELSAKVEELEKKVV